MTTLNRGSVVCRAVLLVEMTVVKTIRPVVRKSCSVESEWCLVMRQSLASQIPTWSRGFCCPTLEFLTYRGCSPAISIMDALLDLTWGLSEDPASYQSRVTGQRVTSAFTHSCQVKVCSGKHANSDQAQFGKSDAIRRVETPNSPRW